MLSLKTITSEVKNHFNVYGKRYNLKMYKDIVQLLGIL